MKKVLVGLFALALSAASLSVAHADDFNGGFRGGDRGGEWRGGPGRGGPGWDNGRGGDWRGGPGRGGDWGRGPGHGGPGWGGPGHGGPGGPGHGYPPPPPPPYNPGYPGHPDYPGHPGNPGGAQVIINCNSGGYRFERCFVRGRIFNAQLVRQYSQSACILGRTWGYEGNSIWVDQGCKGDFAAYVGF